MTKDYWNELPRRAKLNPRERFNFLMNKIKEGSTTDPSNEQENKEQETKQEGN